MGYYGMEKLPKGAKSSDSTGEKRVGASKVDTKGVPSTTGATPPKGATASDRSGERKQPIVGGVGMGSMDGSGRGGDIGKHDGRVGDMKGHMGEKCVYEHSRG